MSEDEPAISFGLALDLKTESYDVEVVEDGEAAVRRGREGAFDLIVLDVMLPRKDGFEVCRELRRGSIQTPILMLTAKSQEAEKVMGLDLGADDYLTKPFSPKELRARIRALTETWCDGRDGKTVLFQRRGSGFRPRRSPAQRNVCRHDAARVQTATVIREELRPGVEPRSLAGFGLGRGNLRHRTRRGQLYRDAPKKARAGTSAPRFLVNVRGQGYRFDG